MIRAVSTNIQDLCIHVWKSANNIVQDRISTLHTAKPSLTELVVPQCGSFEHFRDQVGHRNRTIITKSLTSRVSLCSNTLVCLKLDTVMDITQFLLTASDFIWPRLGKLKLRGFLDEYDQGPARAVDSKEQAISDLLEALVVALPKMPRLMKVDVRLEKHIWNCDSTFQMGLDHRGDTEWQGCIRPILCCNKAVLKPCLSLPTSISAIAMARLVDLPGSLVIELQAAVWKHRRLELAVFCCGKGGERGFSEPAVCCTTWNRKTDTWDLALMNDMDIFIYDMGQYLWQLDNDWGYGW